MVEEKYWGGVCLNVGCTPSKALLRKAELAHLMVNEAKTFCIQVDGAVRFDYAAAFQRSRKVADGCVPGVHLLMKANGITELTGHGTSLDPHTLRVDLADGATETIIIANAVIATGATTGLLPGTARRVSRGRRNRQDSLRITAHSRW